MYVRMYVYFSSGGPSAPKVPYWGTGRAELEVGIYLHTIYRNAIGYKGLVIRNAKLVFTSASISVNASVERTLSSISSAQMAHSIDPVTRQRDDKARLAYRSR
ncbi:hypothetical protein IWW34DRAFT_148043 [Fusarium oxysporum f. sp. albedinis]|nr:hypothetical protein IWW34DRAFT_148043 [Fusarium oxysporum f. sp. albedinis]